MVNVRLMREGKKLRQQPKSTLSGSNGSVGHSLCLIGTPDVLDSTSVGNVVSLCLEGRQCPEPYILYIVLSTVYSIQNASGSIQIRM